MVQKKCVALPGALPDASVQRPRADFPVSLRLRQCSPRSDSLMVMELVRSCHGWGSLLRCSQTFPAPLPASPRTVSVTLLRLLRCAWCLRFLFHSLSVLSRVHRRNVQCGAPHHLQDPRANSEAADREEGVNCKLSEKLCLHIREEIGIRSSTSLFSTPQSPHSGVTGTDRNERAAGGSAD